MNKQHILVIIGFLACATLQVVRAKPPKKENIFDILHNGMDHAIKTDPLNVSVLISQNFSSSRSILPSLSLADAFVDYKLNHMQTYPENPFWKTVAQNAFILCGLAYGFGNPETVYEHNTMYFFYLMKFMASLVKNCI